MLTYSRPKTYNITENNYHNIWTNGLLGLIICKCAETCPNNEGPSSRAEALLDRD